MRAALPLLLLALAPPAAAAPALLVELDAPGWAAWRVLVPPQSSVTFTTSLEGGTGLRAEGGAILKGPGSGGLSYAAATHARGQGAFVSIGGAPLVGNEPRGALPAESTTVTLQCAAACVGGEVVVVRYAAGSFTRAALGVDLAGATVLGATRGADAFAHGPRSFGAASLDAGTRAAAHAENVEGTLVGAFFAQGPATLHAAGPRGVEACECHYADEAHGPGAYAFAAWGTGEAFLVGADARLPPP